MAFTPRTFTGASVRALDDGALYQFFARNQDAIFNVAPGTMTLSANTLSIGQSNWLVGGRNLYTGSESIVLSPTLANGVGRVIVQLTQANSSTPVVTFIQEYQANDTSFRDLTQGTINRFGSQTTYECELCRFTVTNSSCSALVMSIQEGLWGARSGVVRLTHEGNLTSAYWQQPFPWVRTEWLTHSKQTWINNIATYQFTLTRGGYRIDVTAHLPANATAIYGVGLGSGNNPNLNFPLNMQPAFSGAVNRISASGILVVNASTAYNPVVHSNVAVSGTGSLITTIEKLW